MALFGKKRMLLIDNYSKGGERRRSKRASLTRDIRVRTTAGKYESGGEKQYENPIFFIM